MWEREELWSIYALDLGMVVSPMRCAEATLQMKGTQGWSVVQGSALYNII